MNTLTLTQTGTTEQYIEVYKSDFVNIDCFLREVFFTENPTAQNVDGVGTYEYTDYGYSYSIHFSFE